MSSDRRAPAPPPVREREEAFALGGLVALFAVSTAWWALAFWPVDDGPAWLARTRYVCFGVTSAGLPDAGGWIGLVGGPIGMLSMLVVGWGRGVRALLQRARHAPLVRATLALMLLGTVAVVTGAGLRVRAAGADVLSESFVAGGAPALAPRIDRDAPPLELAAHDGARISLENLRGRPALLTFAYGHCSTVCPVIVRDVLRARARLAQAGEPVAVLVVTLDPWRDTPSRLPSIAAGWGLAGGAGWLLGGSVDAVERTLDAWGVPRTRNEANGEIVHPSLVYVIDEGGRIAHVANGDPDALVRLVERL